MNTQLFGMPVQPAEPVKAPEIDGAAYKTGDLRSKAHLPDPYLPAPRNDLVFHPYGWTLSTLCGLVIRRAREARSGDEMCAKCTAKGVRLLREQRATEGRTA